MSTKTPRSLILFSFLPFLFSCFSTAPYGGQDVLTIHMPFEHGFGSRCVQGVNGDYSHQYDSTRFDVDFDTPNEEQIPVYAPYDGQVFVHDQNPDKNFGVHINLDVGDGTYLVLGHLSEARVSSYEKVQAGDLLGYEGSTGYSTGDHLHIGRHRGSAYLDAIQGSSVEGLAFYAKTENGNAVTMPVTNMHCDLWDGDIYYSLLSQVLPEESGNAYETPEDDFKEEVEDNRVSLCLFDIDPNIEALRVYSLTESEKDRGETFYENGNETFEVYGSNRMGEPLCMRIRAKDNEIVAVNGFAYVGDYLGQNPDDYDQSSAWRHIAQSVSNDPRLQLYMDTYVETDSDGDGDPENDRDRLCEVDRFEYTDTNNGQGTDYNSLQVALVCP